MVVVRITKTLITITTYRNRVIECGEWRLCSLGPAYVAEIRGALDHPCGCGMQQTGQQVPRGPLDHRKVKLLNYPLSNAIHPPLARATPWKQYAKSHDARHHETFRNRQIVKFKGARSTASDPIGHICSATPATAEVSRNCKTAGQGGGQVGRSGPLWAGPGTWAGPARHQRPWTDRPQRCILFSCFDH